jgi:hypothetical protein
MSDKKEWMLGLPGHNEVLRLEDVLLLVRGGQLRPTDLVKKLGQPWRAANEIPELMPYFRDEPARRPSETAAPAAGRGDPARSTTGSVPKADRPHPASRTSANAAAPAPAKAARPTTARATVRAERKASTTAVPKPPEAPARASEPAGSKPPPPPVPGPESTDIPVAEKPAPAREPSRPVPKAPARPRPVLEPMVGKYFSPVDLLRSASFAFEPRKLALSAAFAVPVATALSGVLFFGRDARPGAAQALAVGAAGVVIFGVALALTALAYVTRRQIEGREYAAGEVFGYTRGQLRTAFLYPVLVLLPSGLALGVLWLLRFVRNSSGAAAAVLKAVYLVPMFFAFVAVLGAFVYQIASMYVPAAAAVEGRGLAGSVQAAWTHMRRQWGRVVLHWLIVTVAFGVIATVCLGLARLALELPEIVFGDPDQEGGAAVAEAWAGFGVLFALYRGVTFGFGLTLPLSLFATLGTLSYLSLRHPASAPLGPSAFDETSGVALQAAPGLTPAPPEATQPAETRPAPTETTRPAPPEISDDRDEAPLARP